MRPQTFKVLASASEGDASPAEASAQRGKADGFASGTLARTLAVQSPASGVDLSISEVELGASDVLGSTSEVAA